MSSSLSDGPIQAALDLFRRHVWLLVAVFAGMLTTLVAFISALPSVYLSTASIAVEGQQVPTEIVPSPSTLGVEGRLRVLSQRILSRARLHQLAEQFGLYGDLPVAKERQSGQAVATALRRDIGLQVRSDGNTQEDTTVTLEVSYSGTDPEKVRQVTDALAMLYIDENLKERKQQAAGTAEFLRAQLKETQEKLEAQERQVADYKQRHVEELPEHLATNLGTLSHLRSQADGLVAALAAAQQRRDVLTRRLALASSRRAESLATAAGNDSAPTGDKPTDLAGNGSGLVFELATKKGRLEQLLVRFSDKHPDVVQLRNEIASLEQKIALNPAAALPRGPTNPVPPMAPVMSPTQVVTAAAESARRTAELTSLQTEQSTLEAEIQRKTVELASLRKEVAVYEGRVENAPKNDQELQTLTRDYTATHELYLSLLKRLDEALLAGNLERSQQGERFTLVEPALYPQEPVGPRRSLLALAAVILSMGAAGITVLLREIVTPVFHKVEDLRAFTTVEILGSIPRIVTETEWARQRTRQAVGGIALFAMICGLGLLSHSLAQGQVRVAKILSRSNSGIQLR